MKTATDYLNRANAEVPRVMAKETLRRRAAGGTLLMDVRDSGTIAKTGNRVCPAHAARLHRICGRRGHPLSHPSAQEGCQVYLILGGARQVTLARQRLKEMGFSYVHNVGGIGDQKDASSPMED